MQTKVFLGQLYIFLFVCTFFFYILSTYSRQGFLPTWFSSVFLMTKTACHRIDFKMLNKYCCIYMYMYRGVHPNNLLYLFHYFIRYNNIYLRRSTLIRTLCHIQLFLVYSSLLICINWFKLDSFYSQFSIVPVNICIQFHTHIYTLKQLHICAIILFTVT